MKRVTYAGDLAMTTLKLEHCEAIMDAGYIVEVDADRHRALVRKEEA